MIAPVVPSLKKATDACVLASNNASPAQRGPRRCVCVCRRTANGQLSVVRPSPRLVSAAAAAATDSGRNFFFALPQRQFHGNRSPRGCAHPSAGANASGSRPQAYAANRLCVCAHTSLASLLLSIAAHSPLPTQHTLVVCVLCMVYCEPSAAQTRRLLSLAQRELALSQRSASDITNLALRTSRPVVSSELYTERGSVLRRTGAITPRSPSTLPTLPHCLRGLQMRQTTQRSVKQVIVTLIRGAS